MLVSPGAVYKLVIVPAATHMPATTLNTLRALAAAGATIAFVKSLPVAPPGLPQKEQETRFEKAHSAFEKSLRRTEFHELIDSPYGKGRVIIAETVAQLVRAAALRHALMPR